MSYRPSELIEAVSRGELEKVKVICDQISFNQISDQNKPDSSTEESEISDHLTNLIELNRFKQKMSPSIFRIFLLGIARSILVAHQNGHLEVERYLCQRYQFKELNQALTEIEIYDRQYGYNLPKSVHLGTVILNWFQWFFQGQVDEGQTGEEPELILYKNLISAIDQDDTDRVDQIIGPESDLRPLVQHKKTLKAYSRLEEFGLLEMVQELNNPIDHQLKKIWLPWFTLMEEL